MCHYISHLKLWFHFRLGTFPVLKKSQWQMVVHLLTPTPLMHQVCTWKIPLVDHHYPDHAYWSDSEPPSH